MISFLTASHKFLPRSSIISCAALLAALTVSGSPAIAGKYKVLHTFCGPSPCADGTDPAGALYRDSAGNLYGAAQFGGSADEGVIFELAPKGKRYVYKVLYSFQGPEGALPQGSLIADSAGNLFGLAMDGGSSTNGEGVAFELMPNADRSQWTLKVLYNFCTQNGDTCTDGENPISGLSYAGAASGAPYDGASPLYGVTQAGGDANNGTVFALKPGRKNWSEQVLYSFCGLANCVDGSRPNGDLIMDGYRTLYGTTQGGGANNNSGTVFEVNKDKSERTIHDFCSIPDGDFGCKDGDLPYSGMVMNEHQNFLGAAAAGGKNRYGLLYELNYTNKVFTVLHSFCAKPDCGDGAQPYGRLLYADGTIFGVAGSVGSAAAAVLYKFDTTTGGYSVLHGFCPPQNCGIPAGGVVMDSSQNLFGATTDNNVPGVVYEYMP
jgi:uncharacterized repeat protein (TIGR03803 family)